MSVLHSLGPPLNQNKGTTEGNFRGNGNIQSAVYVRSGWGSPVSVGGLVVDGSMLGVELRMKSFHRARRFI